MQLSQLSPTEKEFANFVSLISRELQKYNDPHYRPNLLYLKRNSLLLQDCPSPADRSTSTRGRIISAHNNIREMYEKLDIDLYMLCMSRFAPTRLASLNSIWIDKLQHWWSLKPRITRQKVVALDLCEEFGLSDFVNTPVGGITSPYNGSVGTASEASKVPPENKTTVPEHIVYFEPSEFLEFFKTSDVQETKVQGILPFLQNSDNPPDIKMICPWNGGPSVEIKLRFEVPIKFSGCLLRYKRFKNIARQEEAAKSVTPMEQAAGQP